jgi:hypothetical protein
MLSTENLDLAGCASSKLKPTFVGPFQVKHARGVTVTLQLPQEMKVHPTFHTSRVKPYTGPRTDPPGPVIVAGEEHYEVA